MENPLCVCGWQSNKPGGNATHALVSLCPQGVSIDNFSKSDQEFCATRAEFFNDVAK